MVCFVQLQMLEEPYGTSWKLVAFDFEINPIDFKIKSHKENRRRLLRSFVLFSALFIANLGLL